MRRERRSQGSGPWLVGVLMVVFVLLVRPQEFVPALQTFSVLNAVTAITALGVAVERRRSASRDRHGRPQIPWLVAFIAWCFLVTVRRLGLAGFAVAWEAVGLSAIFMMMVIAAAGTFLRWRTMASALVAVGTLIACVCIHQAQQPAECIAIDTSSIGGERSGEGTADGRPCDNEYICEAQGKPRTAYACEKVGLFEHVHRRAARALARHARRPERAGAAARRDHAARPSRSRAPRAEEG